jgi:hypothetical protein
MKYLKYLIVSLLILGCSNDEVDEQIQKFTIEITSSNGGSVSSSGGSFIEGSSFSVTATPNNGFSFVQWSNGSTSNPLELTVNSNQTIQAIFEENEVLYTLNVTTTEGGTVNDVNGEYSQCSSVEVIASPNDGYQFVRWSNGETDNPLNAQMCSDLTFSPIFEIDYSNLEYITITKESVDYLNIDSANPFIILDSLINTSISDKLIIPPYPVSERLNYIGSEHFMVWWDKDFDHLRLAVSQLKWAEKTWNSSIDEVGFSPLDFTDNEYINIVLKTDINWMNEYNSYDVFYENYELWGTPITANYVGSDFYGKTTVFMPAHPHPEPTLTRLGDLSYSVNNIVHETFHALTSQSYSSNYNDYSWLIESTADWMESRLSEVYPNDYANFYAKVPCFTLNPHRSLWFQHFDFPNYDSDEFKTEMTHRYGASILWEFLERKQIDISLISDIYSNESYTSPQEFLYREIENFENLYFEFVLKNSVYDFPEPIRQLILEWRKSYRGEGVWGVRVGSDLGLNEYKSILNNQENLNSDYEIEPWAYNIFKINKSSTVRTLNLNFQGSENGEYGTDSNFRLGISSEEDGEFEYFYPNFDNNFLENYSLNLDSNKEYFIVVLSFPEVFDGYEKFNYQIEINISEN